MFKHSLLNNTKRRFPKEKTSFEQTSITNTFKTQM